MLTALTGTPGTGKTSAAALLKQRGLGLWTVEDLAREAGCITGYDEDAKAHVVDVERLASIAPPPLNGGDGILEGHLSYRLPVDNVVVLRCSPGVLKDRLQAREYSEEKVRENVEAEAVDVITVEAVEMHEPEAVFELDTTILSPEEVADAVISIRGGAGEQFRPGLVDWSQEVLAWY